MGFYHRTRRHVRSAQAILDNYGTHNSALTDKQLRRGSQRQSSEHPPSGTRHQALPRHDQQDTEAVHLDETRRLDPRIRSVLVSANFRLRTLAHRLYNEVRPRSALKNRIPTEYAAQA